LFALTTTATAQDYPTRPVRIIIPFPPGGFNDIVGRIIATQLSERLGKQFIVENRTGAGGVVGTELAASAPNDGHTLLIGSLALTINPWFTTSSYDPVKSFAPVALIATAPNVISVQPDLPVKSAGDLIALAKEKPGKLQYASAGIGSFMHLGPELFKLMAKVDILHVPFRGGGPALIDVAGGNTHMSFGSIPTTITLLRSGKLRALGVGSLKRNSLVPDVPTIDESGLPGYEFSNWIGIVAPAGTPPAIVGKISQAFGAAVSRPDIGTRFRELAYVPARNTPAEFAQFIRDDRAKWQRVAREADLAAK
jgi:tripartite-type tricarboxylate transporter receptor subunit TctC